MSINEYFVLVFNEASAASFNFSEVHKKSLGFPRLLKH